MNKQKNLKIRGIIMLTSFFILLVVIFSPIFPGKQNGLEYMDNLFNTISKGSVYFIPAALEESDAYAAKTITASLKVEDIEQAKSIVDLFLKNGISASTDDTKITVSGNMTAILQSSLNDADLMFINNDAPFAGKYGYSGKEALYCWWKAFAEITRDLNTQKSFKEAKVFDSIRKKALEPAYNYYGIDSGKYKDYFFTIIFALAFYVVYTLWYGFAIMFLFEGIGMKIGH